MKYNLGQMVMTRGIANAMESETFSKQIEEAIKKYRKCDWGITSEEDAAMNTEAVRTGEDRILAVYETCKGNIWIITEWDRSYTTILFPSEY